MDELLKLIRTVPDFPKKGIMFKDITPLLQDGAAFQRAITLLSREVPAAVSKIIAIESRGFILGGALADKLNKGFVPIRKKGKLPYKTASWTYSLEYGTDTIEIHRDAVAEGEKTVLVDDVLATGGTAEAACKLIETCGGKVEKVIFLIELQALAGRKKLSACPLFSLLTL